MSNYTKTTNFATKDALASGNPAKIVKGTEIDTEFNNIAVASGTKANKASPVFTGTATLPVTNADSLSIGGDGVTVTGIKDEDDMASNSATKLASQQSIKAYVDSQVTAQDLDVTDGTNTIAIDLDSEALSLLGGTGVTSTASGNGVTLAIDSTVATLTGSQTLTNKTLTTPVISGNLTTDGTIDGRDVAVDGTKLDTIETNADVTDTANVTAAGALMDSEVTNLAQVKAFDSTDYATAAQGTTADAALPRTGGAMTGAITTNSTFDGRDVATDGTKLDGIEALADVTDATNVTAAGALMDSELTSIASVKALNQGVATTDSPTFAAATVTGEITANGGIALGDNDKATFGDGDDLQIYHNGNNSFITDTGAGSLYVRASDSLRIQTATNEEMIKAEADGAVTLYNNNAAKLATTSTGIAVTGNAAFADNGKALFGAGDDLQIYHDGTDSFIKETGAGSLKIWAKDFEVYNAGGTETLINADVNAGVQLYFDNAAKLATTSTGINVTGTANATNMQVSNGGKYIFGGENTRITGETDGFGKIRLFTGGTEKVILDGANVGIGTSSPVTTLTASNTTQNDALGIAQVVNTTADDVSSSTLTVKNHSGTGQFMEWRTFGMRIGSRIITNNGVGDVTFTHGNDVEKMRLTATGLGIGTSSPNSYASNRLHLNGASTSVALRLTNTTTGTTVDDGSDIEVSGSDLNIINRESANTRFFTGNTERMRIDSSGNVGIGTSSSIDQKLTLADTSDVGIKMLKTGSGTGTIRTVGGGMAFGYDGGSGTTERLRIDSSGNLLVGTTSTSASVAGGRIFSTGRLVTSVNNEGHYFRRNSSDGTIVEFAKDGTTVGSIGTNSAVMYLGSDDVGLRFDATSNALSPWNTTTAALNDGGIDLGRTTGRFKDLYLSGGVYLGGTGAANKLDDYETGTFAADLKDNTGVVLTSSAGFYTKVGKLVKCRIEIYSDSVVAGNFSGAPYITVPFTPYTSTAVGFYPVFYNGIGTINSGYVTGTSGKLYLTTNRDLPLGNQATNAAYGGSIRLFGEFSYISA